MYSATAATTTSSSASQAVMISSGCAVCNAEHQEGLQVLHYTNGQKYEAHYDYFQ